MFHNFFPQNENSYSKNACNLKEIPYVLNTVIIDLTPLITKKQGKTAENYLIISSRVYLPSAISTAALYASRTIFSYKSLLSVSAVSDGR